MTPEKTDYPSMLLGGLVILAIFSIHGSIRFRVQVQTTGDTAPVGSAS